MLGGRHREREIVFAIHLIQSLLLMLMLMLLFEVLFFLSNCCIVECMSGVPIFACKHFQSHIFNGNSSSIQLIPLLSVGAECTMQFYNDSKHQFKTMMNWIRVCHRSVKISCIKFQTKLLRTRQPYRAQFKRSINDKGHHLIAREIKHWDEYISFFYTHCSPEAYDTHILYGE